MGARVSKEYDPCDALIVDVKKTIEDYVWRHYRDTYFSRWDRLTKKRSDFTVEAPMNYYWFETTYQKIPVKNSDKDNSSSDQKRLLADTKLPQRNKASPKHTSLKTIFRNDTRETQSYNFSFEKTRCSSATVSYQKGFCFGGSTDFSISLPGGEMGTEIGMEMQVTNTEEQTFEESSTMTVNSNILVSEYSQCVADVILEDNHFTGTFKVHVTMEMPSKEAMVFIRNKREEVIHTHRVNRLDSIFPAYRIRDKDRMFRRDAVQFVVEGVIKATQISNQKIDLESQHFQLQTSGKY